MGQPQFFSPEEIAQNIASAEATISSSRSLAARRNSLHEEVERLLTQARSSVQQDQARNVERLLTQTRSFTEQNRANNTGNATPRIGGEPGTGPLSFSESDIESDRDTDSFVSDFLDLPELVEDHPPLQSIASAHPAGFGFAPSLARRGSSPVMNLFGEGSGVRIGYDGNRSTFSPINNVHASGSSGPYASGALRPTQLPLSPLQQLHAPVTASNFRHISRREDDLPSSRPSPLRRACPTTIAGFLVPPGPDEEDIPVDALMHYLGHTGIDSYRVQHRDDGRSILRLRTVQLRDSLLFTSRRSQSQLRSTITPARTTAQRAVPSPGYTYSAETGQAVGPAAARDNQNDGSLTPRLFFSPQLSPVGGIRGYCSFPYPVRSVNIC
jgi:hypothetical protein